jgi:hypothetical protein
MGIKTDKTVHESSTFVVLKQQGCNNNRNSVSIDNTTLISTYNNNNNNNNLHVINDSRSVKQDNVTFSKNQDHPKKGSSPNRNTNVALMIFHQNISGLHNKIDQFLNSWSTESPHILCFTQHHLHDHEINSTCINDYNLGAKYCRKGLKNMVD